VFTKNRERLLEARSPHKFLAQFLKHREVRGAHRLQRGRR
jgi:hypothetical protein